MENASKALLIAGGVLIAILILTIGVSLYAQLSKQSKEYNSTISAVELEKFNSNFDVFVGRTDINAQEIVTVVNLAEKYNNQVKIYLGSSQIKFTIQGEQEEFIKNNQDKQFKCTLNVSATNPNPAYDVNGKITKLTFTN